MKKKNDNFDVLKELRKIRQKNYETTKNMSPEERREYYHNGAMEFRAELEQYRKKKANENNH